MVLLRPGEKRYWKYSAEGTGLNHVVPSSVNKKIKCCTCYQWDSGEVSWTKWVTAAVTGLALRIRTGIASTCITGYAGVAGFTGFENTGGTGKSETGITGTSAAFTVSTGWASIRVGPSSFNRPGLIP
jgi:hypothetical protein